MLESGNLKPCKKILRLQKFKCSRKSQKYRRRVSQTADSRSDNTTENMWK